MRNNDFFDLCPQTSDEEFIKLYGDERYAQLLFVREFSKGLYPHEKVIFNHRLVEGLKIKDISAMYQVSKPYIATITQNIITKAHECYKRYRLGDPDWRSSLHRLPVNGGRSTAATKKLLLSFRPDREPFESVGASSGLAS